MFIDIDIILKPGIVASVEVQFEVSQGYRGDYLDPPEPDGYEITGLAINNVMCFFGRNMAWYRAGRDLIRYGWHDDLVKIAKPLLENDYWEEWQQMADHELSIHPSPC